MLQSDSYRQKYFDLSQSFDSLGQDWDRPVNTGLSQSFDSLGQHWDSAPKSVPVSQPREMTGTAETRMPLRVVPAVPVVPVVCLVRVCVHVCACMCARGRACAYTRARVPCLFTGTTGTTGTAAKMGGRHG